MVYSFARVGEGVDAFLGSCGSEELASNEKRLDYESKTCLRKDVLFSRGSSLFLHLLSPCFARIFFLLWSVRRKEIPCFCTGRGGRSPASADLRWPAGATAALRRRRAGYARRRLLKIVGECHILCYVCSLGCPMGERHEQQTSAHRARQWARMLGSARASPFERPALRTSSPHEACVRKRAGSSPTL